jgi:hypothetical protein
MHLGCGAMKPLTTLDRSTEAQAGFMKLHSPDMLMLARVISIH